MTFTPSKEQQAIFDAVLHGDGNIAVAALAGTGKTTTLVELAKQLPRAGSKIFCAFNKKIVEELDSRLKGTGMYAKTYHSMGYAALAKELAGKLNTNANKYRDLAQDWANNSAELETCIDDLSKHVEDDAKRKNFQQELEREAIKIMQNVCNFVRLKLVDWDNVDDLMDLIHYYSFNDLGFDELDEVVIQSVPQIMRKAEALVREQSLLDFTDMIYWVVRWDLSIRQYDWVFVDECQDLSPMQRAMIRKAIAKNGRIVLVGDENQAIYEFAGADSDSFELSVKEFNAKVLPLSVTRRCAAIVTEHATELVSTFRCLPDAPRGKIVWWPEELMLSAIQKGDLVLSRTKAPLIAACIDCIAANIPATIIGSDIGRALIAMLERITSREDFDWDNPDEGISTWEEEEVEKWLAKGDEPRADAIRDAAEALRTILRSAKSRVPIMDGSYVSGYIHSLFGESGSADVVTFSTVHKSKGLEAERVFILAPEKLPLIYPGARQESIRQEYNLDYVARTRAKHTLVYLVNDKYKQDNVIPGYAQKTLDDIDLPPASAFVTQLDPVPETSVTHDAPYFDDETLTEAQMPDNNIVKIDTTEYTDNTEIPVEVIVVDSGRKDAVDASDTPDPQTAFLVHAEPPQPEQPDVDDDFRTIETDYTGDGFSRDREHDGLEETLPEPEANGRKAISEIRPVAPAKTPVPGAYTYDRLNQLIQKLTLEQTLVMIEILETHRDEMLAALEEQSDHLEEQPELAKV